VSWPHGEHVAVLADAQSAVELAASLRQRLLHGETEYMQHGVMAHRARALAQHLEAAPRIADVNVYPSAFAVLRTALEHQPRQGSSEARQRMSRHVTARMSGQLVSSCRV
jgi:hypothetical protein